MKPIPTFIAISTMLVLSSAASAGEPAKADMPSMPMAHNTAPVNAIAMSKPGNYHARLKLEMHGEWALTMDVSGPLRDRLVKKLQFGVMGEMKHGEGKSKSE
ncbi:MAG: FixH family protein [Proteobacteria bacterium]|nr:FixH family protein [Pseudomonadota bacterium]